MHVGVMQLSASVSLSLVFLLFEISGQAVYSKTGKCEEALKTAQTFTNPLST